MGKHILLLCVILAVMTSVSVHALDYDLNEVLGKSILFYEAQRSGWYEGRVEWRGDSCVDDKGWI